MSRIQGLVFYLAFTGSVASQLPSQSQSVAPPTASSGAPTVAPQSTLPFPAQLKKTVVFIEADCQPTPLELAQLPSDDLAKWFLHKESEMRPESVKKVKHPHSGTGFIVAMHDDRVPQNTKFMYLVTNRHVAQPGIEDGSPCQVFNYMLEVNKREATPGTNSRLELINLGSEVSWIYPQDDSVDLAVVPLVLGENMDYLAIQPEQFATDEMVSNHEIVEGEPVIFAGLFVQFPGISHLEPIVRSGSLAMLPSDPVGTTLKKLGHAYFADTFTFGGNSGSPLLVDIQRFKDNSRYDYRLLGVVSGFVNESNDFTLQVTTDYSGTVKENSGICIIVPAAELRKVLYSPELTRKREEAIAHILQNPKK